MLKFTGTVTAVTVDSMCTAIGEIRRAVERGYRAGSGDSRGDTYEFKIEGEPEAPALSPTMLTLIDWYMRLNYVRYLRETNDAELLAPTIRDLQVWVDRSREIPGVNRADVKLELAMLTARYGGEGLLPDFLSEDTLTEITATAKAQVKAEGHIGEIRHVRCPYCGGTEVKTELAIWTAGSSQDEQAMAELTEAQCMNCALSFWVA